jgi:hypothetical protein
VFANGERRTAVRTNRAKYIQNADAHELYDLSIDPDEQITVHGQQSSDVAIFEDIVASHVRTEQERRLIRDASDELSGSI